MEGEKRSQQTTATNVKRHRAPCEDVPSRLRAHHTNHAEQPAFKIRFLCRTEGVPMKTVGAIALGVLVIATAVPALAEVDFYAGPRGIGVDVKLRTGVERPPSRLARTSTR
jgi:hypothetical protein